MGLGCFRSSKRKLHSWRSTALRSTSTKVCCMNIIQALKRPYRRRILSRLAGGSWVRESRRKAPTKEIVLNICMFLETQTNRKFLGNLRHEEVMKDSGVEIIERLSSRRRFRSIEDAILWGIGASVSWCDLAVTLAHCQEIAHNCPTRDASNPKYGPHFQV